MLLSSTITFTSWPATACTEISGGFGMACWPSGRSRRTRTVWAPTSRPRIATTNMRGCERLIGGRPGLLVDRARATPAFRELLREVRRERSKQLDERVHAVLAASSARVLQGAGKLHHRRDRRVEPVVLQIRGDLADRRVHRAIDLPGAPSLAWVGQPQTPQPVPETVHTVDARGVQAGAIGPR